MSTFVVHIIAAAMLPTVHITPGSVVARPNRAAVFMTADDDNKLSLDQIVAQVQSNLNEGELSTRGEGWFVAQAFVVLGVLFAPPEPVAPAVELAVGLAAIASVCSCVYSVHAACACSERAVCLQCVCVR